VNGPTVGTQFWGVRPVPASAVPAGSAYIGDFQTAMVELVRSEVSVYSSDSHLDYMTKNLILTLVEARTRPIVQRPEALVKAIGAVTPLRSGGGNEPGQQPAQQAPTGRSKAE